MLVGQVSERTDRPAYVRFERVAKENKALSLQEGKFVATDVDYALITPPYSKDVIRQKVASWFDNLEQDVRNDRIPEAWAKLYRDAYRAWQNGQEIPPNGSPIRGWGVLSPAQQENLLRINILTVEDLAGVNDEGLRRVGMGAQELKQKAVAWLRTLHDRGPLTQENAALKSAPLEAHLLLGKILLHADDPSASAKHYRAALAIKPDFAPAKVGLSLAESRLGKDL